MCGRFAMTVPLSTLVKALAIEENRCDVRPGYNIAPGRDIAAVIRNGSRKLVGYKWGLVPHWARDPAVGYKMINARAESISQKPSFKKPFARQRCLIIASGFYEWKKDDAGKRPFFIQPKTGAFFCLAGLYDFWHPPEGRRLATCAIITTPAVSPVRDVHHRMPVIINADDWDLWLDHTNQENLVRPLLQPRQNDDLEIYEVSPRVNSPKNDSPECVQPIADMVTRR